jgi:signal transduction histidine kinase
MTHTVENSMNPSMSARTAEAVPAFMLPEGRREGAEIALHRSAEELHELQKKVSVAKLAGGIAQHFNNILSTVLDCGDLLQTKMRDDDPLKHYVGQMLSSSEKAADLARKLLVFSGQQKLRLKLIDLNEVLIRAERLFPKYLRGDIEANVDLVQEELPVLIDSLGMEQVLANLISNACDAMPGTGKLKLATRYLPFSEEYLSGGTGRVAACALLSVEDTGAGMDRKVKERAFDPFFTTKETGKGIGLGLPVAYHIIKQHNGSIRIESAPGKGTVVNIYLPLAKAQKKENEPIPLLGSREV